MEKVVPFTKVPSKIEAQNIIRTLVRNSRISFSGHALQRMKERGITNNQIIRCLEKGTVIDNPFLSYRAGGGYETTIRHYNSGEWIKAVVCIKFDEKIMVVTTYNSND